MCVCMFIERIKSAQQEGGVEQRRYLRDEPGVVEFRLLLRNERGLQLPEPGLDFLLELLEHPRDLRSGEEQPHALLDSQQHF